MKQVKSKKIYDLVAEQLTEMIISGEYEPGHRLSSVEKLAAEFDVGRSAIREALSALKAMGLIEIHQGEGTFVKKNNYDISKKLIPSIMVKEDLRQLFEVRKLNETGAASIAALNRTDEDLGRMSSILNNMGLSYGNGELGEKGDIDFHMAIVRATNNPMLERLMETISSTVQESMKEARQVFLYSNRQKMELLHIEHQAIYEAIKNKNAEKAFNLMMSHITGVEKELFIK
ncbi:FadR/GntR family transcriptional regulator [Salipaludibacillus sp. CF4.18]|uniref:FadR/GntR family transcriptional regulator n=1 Tax=Salipaludibacillus sp. CF4.18 TaxID=3373081 RepID=UPI003EE69B5B